MGKIFKIILLYVFWMLLSGYCNILLKNGTFSYVFVCVIKINIKQPTMCYQFSWNFQKVDGDYENVIISHQISCYYI